jgi:hypothetical protein
MIEVLKQALEALENNRQTHLYCEDTWYSCPKHEDGCANKLEGDECNCGADDVNAQFDEAITAIKKALAQTEQEPVAWVDPTTLHHLKINLEGVHLVYETEMVNSLPLYEKPQGWRDNVAQAYLKGFDECSAPLLKAKERLIRIMGTFDLATGHADTFDELLDSLESELRDVLGHYRQQRTWVGLTDEDIDQGLLRSNHALQTAGAWRDGVEWATKQLKEKNT